MKPTIALIAASLTLAYGLAAAQANRSLNEARSQVNAGTAPGITIFDFKKKPAPPAASASTPAASGAASAPSKGASAPARSGAVQPTAERGSGLFSKLEPPGGEPLNSAKRLNSPELGIPLPTAASVVKPAPAEPAKAPATPKP